MSTLYVVNDPVARIKMRKQSPDRRIINAGEGLTGSRFDHIEVVDLPPKWKLESVSYREHYKEWVTTHLETCLKPGGTMTYPPAHEEILR